VIQNQRPLIMRNPLFIYELTFSSEETRLGWNINKTEVSTAVWTEKWRWNCISHRKQGGNDTKLQIAIISSNPIQIERATQHMKALPTHNHIMYITSTHSTHLVQDMQDPHFWQKSKVEILDFLLHQRIKWCLLGTSKQLGGEEWWITTIFAIAVVLVLVLHPAALTGIRTFGFTLCCWMVAGVDTNFPLLSYFPKLQFRFYLFTFSPFLRFPFLNFLFSFLLLILLPEFIFLLSFFVTCVFSRINFLSTDSVN